MRHQFGISLALLLAVRAVVLATEPVISAELALPEITRGPQVTIHGTDFPDSGPVVYLSAGRRSLRKCVKRLWRPRRATIRFR